MNERTTPRPVGAPAWVDITVTDIERSQEFYRAVLGWDYSGGEAEFGGYRNATVAGKVVAGMAPPMEGQEDGPHFWTVYLAVDDSEGVAQRITDAGGSTMLPPMQAGPFGTMGIFADPTGAVFATWQPHSHGGFELDGEPGSVAWTEAMVGDFERGKRFYTDVFGWTYEDLSGDGMEYAIFTTPGDEAGMTGGIGRVDAEEAPYWSVVFAVDGTDEAVHRVRDIGGGVLVEPFDFEHGRLAVVTGPDGEPFGLITQAEQVAQD